MTGPVVGFAGLTHLGLVSAVAAASKGFHVIGFDRSGARVGQIAGGRLPVVEPGLDELFHQNRSRVELSDSAVSLGRCDVVYIASDVPTDDEGTSELAEISALIDAVIPVLGESAVLVVLCQVPPGFTRRLAFSPARLYYQAETLVFGRAVERALRPERFIVGCADPHARLPRQYARVLEAFGCPVLLMRYESAELAKIAINCFLAASVGVTNTLAEISERVGADWGEVAPTLRLDPRIGRDAYLAPGLGLAGGNLERDMATVLGLSASAGSDARVIWALLRNSEYRRDWALRTLHAEVLGAKPAAVVGVLGLAYKENTNSTRNSPALALIEHLGPWRVRVYDPMVPSAAAAHPWVTGASSALDAARGADALVVMTPWPAFRELKPPELAAAMAGRAIIDPYRVLDGRAVAAAGLDYFALGTSPVRQARAIPRCSSI